MSGFLCCKRKVAWVKVAPVGRRLLAWLTIKRRQFSNKLSAFLNYQLYFELQPGLYRLIWKILNNFCFWMVFLEYRWLSTRTIKPVTNWFPRQFAESIFSNNRFNNARTWVCVFWTKFKILTFLWNVMVLGVMVCVCRLFLLRKRTNYFLSSQLRTRWTNWTNGKTAELIEYLNYFKYLNFIKLLG